ncbi:MAG: mucoidy inhibitor MuiA family protein [Thermovirgaceae bacterium]
MSGKFLVLAFLASLFTALPAGAAPSIPEAATVDVYPSGAQMRMEFEAGGTVDVELPMTIDPDSLRFELSGTARILDSRIRTIAQVGWVPSALKDLAEETERAKTEKERLSARLEALDQARKHLEAAAPEVSTPGELDAYIDVALAKRETIALKTAETSAALADAKTQYEILRQELESRLPKENDKIRVLTVETAGEGTIGVIAWTGEAGWHPRYQLSLDTGSGLIEGSLQAAVIQKTGLDWNGDISFHTVRPRQGLATPKLVPLVVDYRESFLSKAGEQVFRAADSLEALAPGLKERVEEGLVDVRMETSGFVPGSGDRTHLEIGGFSMPASMEVVCVPEIADEAWTIATIDELDRAILEAGAELFVDGKQTGSTTLEAAGMGQKMVIPFGKTPLVTASREELLPKEGSSWIGKDRLQKGYMITVTNGLDRPLEVVVRDRLPVPAKEEIRIEDVSIDPDPAEQDDKGILTWRLQMESGGTKRITVMYTIRFQGGKDLIFR